MLALLLSKYLNERIGRKRSLIAATILQVVSTLYLVRENKFEPDIEDIYLKLFSPFKVSR